MTNHSPGLAHLLRVLGFVLILIAIADNLTPPTVAKPGRDTPRLFAA